MLIPIVNFIILIASFIIMSYLYTLSVQPKKRSEEYGDKAWKQCQLFRSIGGVFELISTINLILWIWVPLPIVDSWIINENIWIGIIIGICTLIPCGILLTVGIKEAGSETLTPSKDTQMYGGIYNYIRHPQTLGEFPMFVAVSFMLNSWFLVLFSTIGIVIYIPIMIYYEEKDLVRRFGKEYIEYKERTGALFPKLKKQELEENK
ncbi:MAG: methyltransferase family protein [Promethearchaeati archaeon]